MIRKIIYVLVILLLYSPVCLAEDNCTSGDCEAWTQDMFTELVTFLYTNGEVIRTAHGNELYNITISTKEDGTLVGHLGLFPIQELVILTVEKFIFKEDGAKIVDHNFYYSYFSDTIGEYLYLPNYIDSNHIVIDRNSLVEDMTTALVKEYKKEGYDNEEWNYWMGLFYEYMRTQKAKGRSL